MRTWLQALRRKAPTAGGASSAPAGPENAAARTSTARARGNAALAEGRLADAADAYREAVADDPDSALAHVSLGYVLLEQGAIEASTQPLRRALSLRSQDGAHLPDAWFLLGQAQQRLADPSFAVEAYRTALRLRPAFPEAMRELALLQFARRQASDARDWVRRLAELPLPVNTRVAVAAGFYDAGRDEAALVLLDSVLRSDPGCADALTGRGHALLRMGAYDEAAAAFRQALERHGATASRLVDLASALHRLGELAESASLADEAVRLDPSNAAAANLRVVSLTEALELGQAEAVARDALRRHPEDADLHWSLGIALLLQGKLSEGWAEHHWRWRTSVMATTAPAPRPEPAWRGEPLEGRSLVLVAEQGLGDMIQFVRYVPQLAHATRHVILQAPPALHPLLHGLAENCELVSPSAPVHADLHCALMDLPDVLGLEPGQASAAVPYLHAGPERVSAWKEKLHADLRRLKVGVVCSGNPAHTNDRQRSIPLERWAPVLAAGAHFVSLQPQLRDADAQAAAVLPIDLEPARALRDFGETAALLEALDLVITVDTSVAHLAGALGRPVWVLLPHCPDWRWMVARDDSPWYPTARLFRQPVRGDWDAVLASVRQELDRRLAGPRPQ